MRVGACRQRFERETLQVPGKHSGGAGALEDLPYCCHHFCQSNNVVKCRSCLMLLKIVENRRETIWKGNIGSRAFDRCRPYLSRLCGVVSFNEANALLGQLTISSCLTARSSISPRRTFLPTLKN